VYFDVSSINYSFIFQTIVYKYNDKLLDIQEVFGFIHCMVERITTVYVFHVKSGCRESKMFDILHKVHQNHVYQTFLYLLFDQIREVNVTITTAIKYVSFCIKTYLLKKIPPLIHPC